MWDIPGGIEPFSLPMYCTRSFEWGQTMIIHVVVYPDLLRHRSFGFDYF